MGCREGLPDSGSTVCRMWMGLCNLPHGLPVFCRCGPTCAPVTGTAEHDPAALWSSFSSPLQKFLPIFCPLFQQHNPPPPANSTSGVSLKATSPQGCFPDCLLPGFPQSLHFPFLDTSHSQAASPPGACSPKQLICPVPVCLPRFLEGLALSRNSTKIW